MKHKNFDEIELDSEMMNDIDDEPIIVEITDDEGNVYLYEEELVIPIGEQQFALLTALPFEDEDHNHSCDCGCEDDDVIIAKIVINDEGEEEYIEPTEEEFEQVRAAYDKMFTDEERAE